MIANSHLFLFGLLTGFYGVNTWKIAFQPHREGVIATTGAEGGVTIYSLPKLTPEPARGAASVPAKDSKTAQTAPKPPVVLKTPSGVFTTCIAFVRLSLDSY